MKRATLIQFDIETLSLRKLCNPETIPPRSAEEFLHGGASDAEYQNKVLVAQMNSNDAGAIALQQFFFGG